MYALFLYIALCLIIKNNDMNKLELINPKEYGLEEKNAVEITQGLQVALSERELLIKEFEVISKIEVTKENQIKFKELRLKLVKNRTQGIEAWHKTNKEMFLRGGQFVDAIKRKESQINESMESVLLAGEKHFENIEKQRIEELVKQRIEKLSEVCEDASIYPLSVMENDAFDNLYNGLKLAKEQKEAEEKRLELERIEAEKKAELDRLAKIEAENKERERIEKENAKLKAEAEAKEKALKLEREKAEAEKKAIEEKARKEREEVERLAKIEREKQAEIQAKKDAELKEIQEKALKLEREKQAEIDRLKAIELQKQKEAEALAKSSDKNKLNVWVETMIIETIEPSNLSDNSVKIANDILLKFESFKIWAKTQVQNM